MNVKVISLNDLLAQALGLKPAEDTGAIERDINRKMQVRMREIEVYKKRVVERIGTATQEVIGQLCTNHCDHPDHRMIPESTTDMVAVFNAFIHLQSLFHDSFDMCLQETMLMANRLVDSDSLQEPPNPSADALHAVIKQAMQILGETIREHAKSPNAILIMTTWRQRLPEAMAQFSERLLTGKEPTKEAAHSCKH